MQDVGELVYFGAGVIAGVPQGQWKREKSCDQPGQHIKKKRHYSANKGLVKAMVFLVVMYVCETWTIKKADHQRIDACELC